jgi:hypothetical protein
MTHEPARLPRHRFPAEIISHAVWLYHVFSLSLRDVELILAERGIVVTHESIRHWCLKFGTDFAGRLRRRRPRPGDTWHLDEVFIRIRGVQHYLWRMASSWIFWCRSDEMAPLPSGSSSNCWAALGTSHDASSRTGCAAMASLSELSCPMCVIGRAGT